MTNNPAIVEETAKVSANATEQREKMDTVKRTYRDYIQNAFKTGRGVKNGADVLRRQNVQQVMATIAENAETNRQQIPPADTQRTAHANFILDNMTDEAIEQHYAEVVADVKRQRDALVTCNTKAGALSGGELPASGVQLYLLGTETAKGQIQKFASQEAEIAPRK